MQGGPSRRRVNLSRDQAPVHTYKKQWPGQIYVSFIDVHTVSYGNTSTVHGAAVTHDNAI